MVERVDTPGGVMRLCARFSCVAEMNAAAPVNVMPAAPAEATLIDNHDTVDVCAATGGRATEFVSR